MGTLYIVSTPIGNMEDITIRAIKTLFAADYIACEDTRKTGTLMQGLESGIRNQELKIKNLDITHKPKLISFYDEIEYQRVPEIANLLVNDNNVALVSDSGTPLVSDPGYKLVAECIRKKIKVESIPGPSSVTSAIVLSGLPPNKFLFLGYLPPKSAKRQKLLQELFQCIHAMMQIKPTIIFLETPHRIRESLNDLREICGDTEIVIARELTKIHEEIWRGKISEAQEREFKGELVILLQTTAK